MEMCCVESDTASAIGPAAVAKRFVPVLRYSTMSSSVHLSSPTPSPLVIAGANQPCSA